MRSMVEGARFAAISGGGPPSRLQQKYAGLRQRSPPPPPAAVPLPAARVRIAHAVASSLFLPTAQDRLPTSYRLPHDPRLTLRDETHRLAILFLLAFALAGCATRLDADQARICRTIVPVLNPQGSEIRVLRQTAFPDSPSLRIDYRRARRAPCCNAVS